MILDSLSSQTRATLLLCAVLPSDKERAVQPLTTGEYHRLRTALSVLHSGVAALSPEANATTALEQLASVGWDTRRLAQLLARAEESEAVAEKWNEAELWIVGYEDEPYPARWRERLRDAAPPLLFGAGHAELMAQGGLAIVGSRHADDAALEFTARLGSLCAEQKITVISGGARGVDQTAMLACLDANGCAVGLLADSLVRSANDEKYRVHLDRSHLALVSPFSPEAPFNIGNAMGRNKLIYSLADAAMVVSADAETGGTWNGAIENLKQRWTPLIVRDDAEAPRGNTLLMRRGGIPVQASDLNSEWRITSWFTPPENDDSLSLFPK